MIRINEFRKIDCEVQNAIREAFDFGKNNEKDKNDYYLFLCNASYVKKYDSNDENPYIIDYRIDFLIDNDRLDFLTKYLKTYYSFSQYNTSDSKESLTMEMMMYSHIWESKNYLKQLSKLLDLCNSKEYQWNYIMPHTNNGDSKQQLIRNTIRDGFKAKSLKIADIISNSYRSQFRNAFAHSDYSFGLNDEGIIFHNYKPNSHEVKSVGIDEWSSFFCHSFMLNYHFQNYYYQERQKIDSPINLYLRNKTGDKKKGIIQYDKVRDAFNGQIIEP